MYICALPVKRPAPADGMVLPMALLRPVTLAVFVSLLPQNRANRLDSRLDGTYAENSFIWCIQKGNFMI
jgi:hypothetical protein